MNRDDAVSVHIPVRDLSPGDTVLQLFEVRGKELRKTKTGSDYVDLTIGDATGALPGKMWSEALRKWGQDFNPGDFVKIEGRVDTFRDQMQLVIGKIRTVLPTEIEDLRLLVRSAEEDPETLFQRLRELAQGLAPRELAELVGEILDRNEEDLKAYPAAALIHHAYRGGLIEHTVSVCAKVEAVLDVTPNIDRDIAVAGAILHDIGKLRELKPVGGGRTREGRLIGHVILGVNMVREVALEMGIADQGPVRELEHILLSHHGETQFGAPVRPMTREALLVHFIDNLDSKLKIIDESLESAGPDGFAPYNKWLEGRPYAGSRTSTEEKEEDHA